MNKSAIALTLCMLSGATHGAQGDMWLSIHGFSSHLSADDYWTGETAQVNGVTALDAECMCVVPEYKSFNEFNPGLGVTYELVDSLEVRTGFYHNSFYQTSVYGSFNWHTSYYRPVAIGLQAGLVTGYQNTPMNSESELMPFLLPTISGQVNGIRVELGYVPKITQDAVDVITLNFAVQFR